MNKHALDKIKNAFDIFEPETALDVIQYTINRDALDRRYFPKSKGIKTRTGKFRHFTIGEFNIKAEYENATLELTTYSDSVLRVAWQGPYHKKPVLDYSENIHKHRSSLKVIEQAGTSVTFNLDIFSVKLQSNGSFEILDSSGELLRKDDPPDFLQRGFQHSVEIPENMGVYGFGERAFSLNLKGRRINLWNTDPGGSYGPGSDPIYLNIPVYLARSEKHQFLCFYQCAGKSVFDLGVKKENRIWCEFSSGSPDYFLFFGDLANIYRNYSILTGFPHLPPKWSLGFHQSKWSYTSTEEVESVAAGFRKNDLDISAIHLDIDYMEGYRVFTFNGTRFSDIVEVSSRLEKQNVRLVAIVDPAVKWDPEFPVFQEGISGQFFCKSPDGNILYAPVWPGLAAYPDFSLEAVRKWWGSLYDNLTEKGISGFWHDMNEPVAFVLWGNNTLPYSTLHGLGSHEEIHNLYGLFMVTAAYEHLTSKEGNERPFILSRSGWAGLQKFSWVWTGDTESSWEGLKQTIATVLGLSISGIPLVGSDTGGFDGNPSEELFVRWFQVSSFMPFFRTHSSRNLHSREPWKFGEPYLTIIRKYLKNRYRMLPFYYSEVFRCHATGEPLIRPLFWNSTNPAVLDNDSAFMLGDSMLVFPVLLPGVEIWHGFLPDGIWYDYWDPDKCYDGDREVTVSVDLGTIPVFIRGGAIVPCAEEKRIVLSIYFPKEDSQFSYSVYDDDSILGGRSSIDVIEVEEIKNVIHLRKRHEGDYPWSYNSTEIRIFGRKCNEMSMDGTSLTVKNNSAVLDGDFNELAITTTES